MDTYPHFAATGNTDIALHHAGDELDRNRITLVETHLAAHSMPAGRFVLRSAAHGRELCRLDGRSLRIDDDVYLIINDDAAYDTRIAASRSVESFAIEFRRGLAEEVLSSMVLPIHAGLEFPDAQLPYPVHFTECLRAHDSLVSPPLRFIRHHARRGVQADSWYEDQLLFLFERMLRSQQQIQLAIARIPAVRRATRRELFRRVSLATDYIESNYENDLTLADLASVASMSRCHLLRWFTLIHDTTPREYLQRRRLHAAMHLLELDDAPIEDVAAEVGLERGTLARRMRRHIGTLPTVFRQMYALGNRI